MLARFDELSGTAVVFAARKRRSEGLVFRSFYQLYRLIHLTLTGIPVRVGNFCILPANALHRLVVVSDLWNHFAASVFKAQLPLDMVPTARAQRLAGRPAMSFTSLAVHGLSAISVFGDRVGVRGILLSALFFLFTIFSLLGVVSLRLFTDLAIPGWASYTAGVLVLLALQLLMLVTVFAFIVLGSRDTASFLPNRDHVYFVSGLQRLWPLSDVKATAR